MERTGARRGRAPSQGRPGHRRSPRVRRDDASASERQGGLSGGRREEPSRREVMAELGETLLGGLAGRFGLEAGEQCAPPSTLPEKPLPRSAVPAGGQPESFTAAPARSLATTPSGERDEWGRSVTRVVARLQELVRAGAPQRRGRTISLRNQPDTCGARECPRGRSGSGRGASSGPLCVSGHEPAECCCRGRAGLRS